MVQTIAARGDNRVLVAPRERSGQGSFLSRWLRIWVVMLTVVTAVVVVYLIVITNTLASINGNLRTATRGVVGTGQNVVSLPAQVDQINGSLAAIDPALKPVPNQANEIIAALSSINNSLSSADSSLKETSSVLTNVGSTVISIRDLLVDANDPADRLGVQNIHRRIASVNGVGDCGQFCTGSNLTTAETDAANILKGLVSINRHLNSICTSFVGRLITGTGC